MRALTFLLASAAVLAGPAYADIRPQDTVTLAASEPMTLAQFADALRVATGRPVLIGLTPDRAFLRDDRGHRIKASWNGNLSDLLNAVAPRFGVQWAIENDAILFFDAATVRPKPPAPKPSPKVELVDVVPSNIAPPPSIAAASALLARPSVAPNITVAPAATPAPGLVTTPVAAVVVAPAAVAAPARPAAVVTQGITVVPAPPVPMAVQTIVTPASVAAPLATAGVAVAATAAPAPRPSVASVTFASPAPVVQAHAVLAPKPASAQAIAQQAIIPDAGIDRDSTILDLAQFQDAAAVEPAPTLMASTRATPRRARGTATVPGIDLVSANSVGLDAKESYGVELANRWKSNPDKPRQGEDGSVRYLYGATLPTLVCSPLEVCAIQLQPGEVVNDVHAGDTARWRITPANSGSGENATTLVIVKPIDAGLTTNLFIATDRRIYSIKLVSSQKAWMPIMSFDYPDDVQRQWASFRQRQTQQVQRDRDTTLPTNETGGENIASLDFSFRVSGDRPRWTPTRIYSDGAKTYIQFPSARFEGEAPALVELGRGSSTQMVNYRVIGDRYVVDHVIERAALISGVGRDQTRVVIEHKEERR